MSDEPLTYSAPIETVNYTIAQAIEQEVTYLAYQHVEKYGRKLTKKEIKVITARLYHAATTSEITYARSN